MSKLNLLPRLLVIRIELKPRNTSMYVISSKTILDGNSCLLLNSGSQLYVVDGRTKNKDIKTPIILLYYTVPAAQWDYG
jgi:hypothetical protein